MSSGQWHSDIPSVGADPDADPHPDADADPDPDVDADEVLSMGW
jgi:hypothetical protein